MPSQAIYRRWRPQKFEDVYGQGAVVRTLSNALESGRLAHAYLLTGPRGTGKTSIARILAKAVNCSGGPPRPCDACDSCRSVIEGRNLDLIEIDAASNTGVDDVRDLRDKVAFAPAGGRYKVYIVDEVHMLSTAAFNALLKTLEEPPDHVIFVLATTEPHKLPDTIVSRCQRYDMRRVPVAECSAKLRQICDAEGIEADDEALKMIARSATGSVRDAESLLDLLFAGGQTVTVARVQEALGTAGSEAVSGMVAALIDLDAGSALRWVNNALDAGADPVQLQAQLTDRLRQLLLIQTGLDTELLEAGPEELALLRTQAAAISRRQLARAVRTISEQEPSADRTHPGLPLEIALVELVLAAESDSAAPHVAPAAQASNAPATSPSERARPKAPPISSEEVARSSPPATQTDRAAAAPARKTDRDPAAAAGESDREPTAAAGQSDRAAAPPAGQADPAPATPQVGPSAGALQDNWGGLVRLVETRDRRLAALLKDCRAESADDASVTLGFFFDFHCRQASEPAQTAVLSECLARLTGLEREVRCIRVSPTAAEKSVRPKTRAEQATEDPLIKHAVTELGARVTAVRTPDEGSVTQGDVP